MVVCDWLGDAGEGKWRNLAKHPVADFCQPERMLEWLDDHRADVEVVVHMGAISSTTEPDADLVMRSNFVLSRDLYRWCAEAGTRLIYASSAATYGDGRGHAPPQWVGLKFFNVYGPNEAHKGEMKSVVAQIWPDVAGGRPVKLFKSYHPDYADGGQLRDFVSVADVTQVVEWLVNRPTVSGVFNLGSGAARSFKDLAEAVFTAAGQPSRIEYVEMPETLRPRYQYFTEARLERLRAAGYDGQFASLESGVGDYVTHFLSQPDPYR